MRNFFAARLGLALAFLLLAPSVAPQGPPKQPLDEIVRHFAQKESDYASAHALYQYELNIRLQEIAEEGGVLGEFEQTSEVDFDPSGRRRQRLLANPRVNLTRLDVTRIELDDISFIPLFVLLPEQIPDYEITYLTSEHVDEVDTHLFRLAPRTGRIPRPGEHFFEGIVWVDAHKLDVVRAHGRSLPVRSTGALKEYFRRVEVYREPVGDFLFPTYVRADDVLSVRDLPLRARLLVRFRNHQRVR